MRSAARNRNWVTHSSLCAIAFFLALALIAPRSEAKDDIFPATETDKAATVATHRQSSIVEVNVAGEKPIKIACFCLTPDDRILVGGAGETGEIRVFDAGGKPIDTWKTPINPEAISVRTDGAIFVAGDGQLLKLSSTGEVELTKEAPHAAALSEHPEKLREEVIAQAKQRADMLGRQGKVYEQRIELLDKNIATMKEQIMALEKPADDAADDATAESDSASADEKPAPTGARSLGKPELDMRLALLERQRTLYVNAKVQWEKMGESRPSAEMCERQKSR